MIGSALLQVLQFIGMKGQDSYAIQLTGSLQPEERKGIVPRMREAQIEKMFYHLVRKHGGMAVKLAPTTAGVPDRLVLWPGGRVHLVELKTDGGPVRAIQQVWHRRAAALGTHVHLVRGADGVRAYVDKNGTRS